MKRILLLTAFLIVNLSLTWSRLPDTLSDSARFSLITVAPGEFVYSTFGHTALRLKDAASGVDVCFNYGTFDFEQPGFVLKFCQGKLLYMLDIENYRDFEYGNLYFRRPMIEQVLNLSPEQKSKLYALLRDNYRPENRFYKYDFFYDNCATRVRDILENTLGGNPGYHTEMAGNGVTMRQLLHKYLPAKPWLGFGIDLILGTPADKIATVRDYMFLPDYLYLFLGKATTPGGQTVTLQERMIPSGGVYPPLPQHNTITAPLIATTVLSLVGLFFVFRGKGRKYFDNLFWGLLGTGGIIIALLWFATDHTATKYNLNLLWMLPTHLALPFLKPSKWKTGYLYVTGITAALLLAGWQWLPQQLPVEIIPILLLITIKTLFQRN
ncbi:MAG: DUF4105 domain-containing protein [Bacteroidota bacterium]